MLKKFKLFLVLVFTVLLSGCFGTFGNDKPPPDVVIKTRTVVVAPPDSLLIGCDVVKPFTKDEYLSADIKGREKLLVEHIVKQNNETRKCNDTFVTIKDWRNSVVEIYKNGKDVEIKNK